MCGADMTARRYANDTTTDVTRFLVGNVWHVALTLPQAEVIAQMSLDNGATFLDASAQECAAKALEAIQQQIDAIYEAQAKNAAYLQKIGMSTPQLPVPVIVEE